MRRQATIWHLVLCAAGIALGGCLDDDPAAADLPCTARWRQTPAPSRSAAELAVVAACQRAPVCPIERSCTDPRWPWLADAVLDDMVACFIGPCEERGRCLAELMPVSCPPPPAMLQTFGGEGTS